MHPPWRDSVTLATDCEEARFNGIMTVTHFSVTLGMLVDSTILQTTITWCNLISTKYCITAHRYLSTADRIVCNYLMPAQRQDGTLVSDDLARLITLTDARSQANAETNSGVSPFNNTHNS